MKIRVSILFLAVFFALASFARGEDTPLSPAPVEEKLLAPVPAVPPAEDPAVLCGEPLGPGTSCDGEESEPEEMEEAGKEGGPEGAEGVPSASNESVEYFLGYFQSRGKRELEKWLSRLEDYDAVIRPVLMEEGVPEDLIYVALIESGLNPRARSRRGAVGVWQFMEKTAKGYGLRVDWWIDERMDAERSTRAAARYFKDLYGRFTSWHLAVAGYNAGAGKVMKAARMEGSSDFWVLAKGRTLKRETVNFVPKYLAVMTIANDPGSFGFEAPDFRENAFYEKVEVPYSMDLRVVARAAGVTLDEVKRLNPQLLRPFTPPNYEGFEIKLPPGSSGRFKKNIQKAPPPVSVRFVKHKVRKGETVWGISRKYGSSVKTVLYLNGIEKSSRLRPGRIIMVPVKVKNAGKRVDVVKMSWDLKG